MANKPGTWGAASFLVTYADGNTREVTVSGRDRWALEALIKAGERGCTPIETPGPRWSGYAHNLRNMGIPIETVRERHGGPFSGTHGRYVLRAKVERQGERVE